MDQRRFLTFFTLSMLLWFGWLHFLVPKLWPVVPKPRVPAVSSAEVDVPADATVPENAKVAEAEQPAVAPLPKHPVKSVWLGPQDGNRTVAARINQTKCRRQFRRAVRCCKSCDTEDLDTFNSPRSES